MVPVHLTIMVGFRKMINKLALVSVPLLVLTIGAVQSTGSSENVNLTMCGLVAPVFTPFDKQGNLNLSIIPKYAKFLKGKGVNGVLVSGTTGEGPTLSLDQRKKLLQAWLKASKAIGLKVMSQAGGLTFPDVEELVEFSEKIGVDAILVIPEIYYSTNTVEKLLYFMECVARRARNTPILYYHMPKYTHVDVDIVTFFEKATMKISNFKGLKCDLETAVKLRSKLQRDQRIFVADVLDVFLPTLLGYNDFIVLYLNIFPELSVTLIKESKSCNLTRSRAIYEQLLGYQSAIVSQGRDELIASKAAMTLVTGINVGPINKPQIPLTNKQAKELEASLKKKGIKIKSSVDEW